MQLKKLAKVFRINLSFYKLKSLFVRYFTLFLLLFVLPVIAGATILYLSSVERYKSDMSTYNRLVLKQTSEIINQKLTDLYQSVYKIANNTYVYEFITLSGNEASENINMYYALDDLNAIQNSSDIIEDIILYSQNNHSVISSKGGTFDFHYFFDQIYHFEGMDSKFWEDKLKSKSSFKTLNKIKLDNNSMDPFSQEPVIIVSSLPLQSEQQGSILLFLKGEYFSNILKEISSRINCRTFILNRDLEYVIGDDYKFFNENRDKILKTLSSKAVVTSVSFDDTDSIEYIVNTMELKISGWNFIILSDAQQVYSSVNLILRIFFGIIIGFLIIGIIVSYLLAKKAYKPIANIMSNVRESTTPVGNELDYINQLLHNIIAEKNDLVTASEENRPIIRRAVLNSLITGKKPGNMLLEEKILHYRYKHFRALTIRLEPLVENAVFNCDFKLQEFHIDIDYIKDEWNQTVLLLNYDDQLLFNCWLDSLRLHMEAISRSNESWYFIYIGNEYSYIEGLRYSYEEALKAADSQKVNQHNLCIRYWNEGMQNDKVIYTIDIENKLFGSVISGDIEATAQILKDIFSDSLRQQISIRQLGRTVDDLLSTLSRCISMLTANDNERLDRQFDSNLVRNLVKFNFNQLQQHMNDLFITYAEYALKRKDNRNYDTYLYLLEYIKANYHLDIYLDRISDDLKLSPDYLRKIFKMNSGTTFVDYLNKVRIDHSKEMLVKSDFKIADISLKVGFDSINTFYKTFKKYEGMSPGQYSDLKNKVQL